MAKTHVRIYQEHDKWWIKNLDRKIGTYLVMKNQKIPIELTNGMIMKFFSNADARFGKHEFQISLE